MRPIRNGFDGGEDDVILETPEPPADVPYAELHRFRSEALLTVNGIPFDEPSLVETLGGGDTVLQAAAAFVLGEIRASRPIVELTHLARSDGDLARVEAAYALVRIVGDERRPDLEACLDLPVDAYIAPQMAAGYLARLGDPAGFSVVARGMRHDNLIIRMVAIKQLYFFAPFEGLVDFGGTPIDVVAEFRVALRDPHPDPRRTALLQLRQLPELDTRALLLDYAAEESDEALRSAAMAIVAGAG